GDRMDLMLDPACEYITFGDALKVGWACDEARYFWYEDPYRDGGISQFAHRKLRQLIKTPLLMTEHVRTLELHADFALADATDFLRGDVGYDGITGVMKLAHAAEGSASTSSFMAPVPPSDSALRPSATPTTMRWASSTRRRRPVTIATCTNMATATRSTRSTRTAVCPYRKAPAWESRSIGTGWRATARPWRPIHSRTRFSRSAHQPYAGAFLDNQDTAGKLAR